MNRKILGCCLVAVCAVSGLLAAGASASPPELGRCVKAEAVKIGTKTHYTGAFATANCLKVAPGHAGRFEWLPGPGTKPQFSGVALEITLQTVGGVKVTCASMSLKEGQYTGAKTAKVAKILLTGCSAGTEGNCETIPTKEGEIESGGEMQMELARISKGAQPVVGWDLKREGTLFTFECGKLPEIHSVQTIEGSVIGRTLQGAEWDLNKMSITGQLKYSETGGKQLPEAFEEGSKDVLTTTKLVGLTKTTEQTGVATTLELTSGLGGESGKENPENQEKTEIKSRV